MPSNDTGSENHLNGSETAARTTARESGSEGILLRELDDRQKTLFLCKVVTVFTFINGLNLLTVFLCLGLPLPNDYIPLLPQVIWFSIIIHITFLLTTVMLPNVVRYEPINYIMLITFTINLSILMVIIINMLPWKYEILASYSLWFTNCCAMTLLLFQDLIRVTVRHNVIFITVIVVGAVPVIWFTYFPIDEMLAMIYCVTPVYILSLLLILGSNKAITKDDDLYTARDYILLAMTLHAQFLTLFLLITPIISNVLKTVRNFVQTLNSSHSDRNLSQTTVPFSE